MTAFASAPVVPNDPDYSKQWGLAKINAPGGWGIYDGLCEVIRTPGKHLPVVALWPHPSS